MCNCPFARRCNVRVASGKGFNHLFPCHPDRVFQFDRIHGDLIACRLANATKHQRGRERPRLACKVTDLANPNARFLEDTINDAVSLDPEITDVILMCSAVNIIDASALESLEQINHRLGDAGIALHLSEVKVPLCAIACETDHIAAWTSRFEGVQPCPQLFG